MLYHTGSSTSLLYYTLIFYQLYCAQTYSSTLTAKLSTHAHKGPSLCCKETSAQSTISKTVNILWDTTQRLIPPYVSLPLDHLYSTPILINYFIKVQFNVIHLHLWFPSGWSWRGFPIKNLQTFLVSPYIFTFPNHHGFFDFTIPITHFIMQCPPFTTYFIPSGN